MCSSPLLAAFAAELSVAAISAAATIAAAYIMRPREDGSKCTVRAQHSARQRRWQVIAAVSTTGLIVLLSVHFASAGESQQNLIRTPGLSPQPASGSAVGSAAANSPTRDRVAPAASAPPRVVPGQFLELAGDGGHVKFRRPLIGERTTFTIEMWIQLSWPPIRGAPNPERNLIYVESYVGGGPLNGCQRHFTFVSADSHETDLDCLGSTTMTSWPNSGHGAGAHSPAIPEGAWHHVAYVRQGDQLAIFLDGAPAGRGFAPTYMGPPPTEFHLGLFVNPVSGNEWGRFRIDDLRISEAARYGASFAPEATLSADSSTISLWTFDETEGNQVFDSTGHEPPGELRGGARRVPADR